MKREKDRIITYRRLRRLAWFPHRCLHVWFARKHEVETRHHKTAGVERNNTYPEPVGSRTIGGVAFLLLVYGLC
jgi:hypothetical protein